jgi:hypothetical protein
MNDTPSVDEGLVAFYRERATVPYSVRVPLPEDLAQQDRDAFWEAAKRDAQDVRTTRDPRPWVSHSGFRTAVQAWHPIYGASSYRPREVR